MYRIGKEEIEAVARVIETRSLFKINNNQKETEKAEAEARALFGTKNALLMTSGHAALSAALIAMGIGPGDEVIVPAYTYIATAMAVVQAGAIPVIAEIDETRTLCPIDTEKKITPRTKAIIPVHIQGFPCNMDAFTSLGKKYGIKILEDACQSVGGSYKGKRLGTVGDAGALSFNYFKVITAGEGGALLTDDKQIAERALIYHDSSAVAYFGDQLSGVEEDLFCGNEYRTNEVSSAILRQQMKRLDGILHDLRENKKKLKKALTGVCGFIPSNDEDGDCATTLAIAFDSAEKTEAFAKKCEIGVTVPINTGKHVYTNWTPIMQKKGALHPLMDPFKMEANKDIVPDYSAESCLGSLELLKTTAYIGINPDWTDADLNLVAEKIKKALI